MPFTRCIQKSESLHFVTFAVVQWVDMFTCSTYVVISCWTVSVTAKKKKVCASMRGAVRPITFT